MKKPSGKARPKTRLSKFEIAKLELHDGDILVVRSGDVLTQEQCTTLRDAFQKLVGGAINAIKVVVLSGGLSLAVLRDKRAVKPQKQRARR